MTGRLVDINRVPKGFDKYYDVEALSLLVPKMFPDISPKIVRECEKKQQVYFMKARGYMKIGHSFDVWKRLSSLQTGNPHCIILLLAVPGGKTMEKEFQKQFERYQHRHEWFEFTDMALGYLEDLRIAARRDIDADMNEYNPLFERICIGQ